MNEEEQVLVMVGEDNCIVCDSGPVEAAAILEDPETVTMSLCFLHAAAFELWRQSRYGAAPT